MTRNALSLRRSLKTELLFAPSALVQTTQKHALLYNYRLLLKETEILFVGYPLCKQHNGKLSKVCTITGNTKGRSALM